MTAPDRCTPAYDRDGTRCYSLASFVFCSFALRGEFLLKTDTSSGYPKDTGVATPLQTVAFPSI